MACIPVHVCGRRFGLRLCVVACRSEEERVARLQAAAEERELYIRQQREQAEKAEQLKKVEVRAPIGPSPLCLACTSDFDAPVRTNFLSQWLHCRRR
jgi:hypothetical protein